MDTGDAAGNPLGPSHPYVMLEVHRRTAPEEEIGPQLGALGIQPADVRWGVQTHLHIDHDGGLKYFPEAEILVSAGA